MPIVSRLFVKTSLVFFVLTFVSGGMLLAYQSFGKMDAPWGFIVAHACTVGWLVMGVAYWMYPPGQEAVRRRTVEIRRRAWPWGQLLAGVRRPGHPHGGRTPDREGGRRRVGRNLGPFRNCPDHGGAHLRVGDLVSRLGNRRGGSMSQGPEKSGSRMSGDASASGKTTPAKICSSSWDRVE